MVFDQLEVADHESEIDLQFYRLLPLRRRSRKRTYVVVNHVAALNLSLIRNLRLECSHIMCILLQPSRSMQYFNSSKKKKKIADW